ncbi:universal stress protein [Kitasatospora sp. NPDC048722]|uniref:universal stress protein n=1 Tax=Kitasatospora sp. NPDC048722 TaxID=3155639 RepID=UPI0033ECB18C
MATRANSTTTGGTRTVRRIVAGVDGPEVSWQALRWAVDRTRLTGAVVEAVTAWTYPTVTAWARPKADPQTDRSAQKALARAVEDVAGPEPPLDIRQRAVQGDAAEALLRHAIGAEPLVVDRRGYGGCERALPGPVSRPRLAHAPCPVVVAPTAQDGPPHIPRELA